MANTEDENRSKNWIQRLKATSRFIFSQRKLSLAADKSISVPPTFAIGPKWGKRLELGTAFGTLIRPHKRFRSRRTSGTATGLD